MSDVDDFLEHYGVKGMKWGVQRASKHKPSSEGRKVREIKKRPAHSLTDKQLKEANARMNLEQNYNRLNPTTLHRGRNHILAVLAFAATANELQKFTQSAVGRRLMNIGSRFIVNPTTNFARRSANAATDFNFPSTNLTN